MAKFGGWRRSDGNGWQDEKCLQCGLSPNDKGHDPCIENLPQVRFACCGHGQPLGGYLALQDGRCVYFKYRTPDQIRVLLARALEDLPLDDDVRVCPDSWFAGLNDAQFDWVWQKMHDGGQDAYALRKKALKEIK